MAINRVFHEGGPSTVDPSDPGLDRHVVADTVLEFG